MKKILFVSALGAELKIVKGEIKKLNISKKDLEISFFDSGFGNYKTILNLTEFLGKNHFDFIVNIGVCGYSDKYEKLIQITRIFNLANTKELISPVFFGFADIKSIASSEKIIFDKKELLDENFVDMESYGFELVLEKFKIPRMILKIPVDKIGEETKNFDYEKAKKYLSKNIDYKKLVGEIEKYLEKNNKQERKDLEKFFEKINFSKSQEVIFEKLFNKYEVLVGEDFENYLDNFFKKFDDKKIEKKDVKIFLKDLELFLEDK